jgi:hypothetical protein
MPTDTPVRYKYVHPKLLSDNVMLYMERFRYPEPGETVRLCLVGPRGGRRGELCVDGQELADALAAIGYRAKARVEADDG